MATYEHTPREKWLFLYPAQVALAGTQIWWTTEVKKYFDNSRKRCSGERCLCSTGGGLRECVEGLLQEADRAAQHAHRLPLGLPQQGRAPEGELSIFAISKTSTFFFQITYKPPSFSNQVMTICTIDVHSRDTVSKMIQQKVETIAAFSWQSQLRHRWQN